LLKSSPSGSVGRRKTFDSSLLLRKAETSERARLSTDGSAGIKAFGDADGHL